MPGPCPHCRSCGSELVPRKGRNRWSCQNDKCFRFDQVTYLHLPQTGEASRSRINAYLRFVGK